MKYGPEVERTAAPIPRQAAGSQVRLSFAQERIWLFEQLYPGTHAHHLAAQILVDGPLDPAALSRAARAVVTRHETLRTAIRTFDGVPMQVVTPVASSELETIDLSLRAAVDRDVEVRRSMSEQIRRPFDLSRPPLFRSRLLRLGASEHVLQLVIHQLIADTHSLELMLNELATIYSADVDHVRAPLPELPVQYREYAAWQRARFDDDKRARQLAYWKAKLAGDLRPVEVPLDFPRPAIQTFVGEEEQIELSAELVDELRRLTDGEINLTVVLMAAFYVLLFRYTGEEDLFVGTPIMQRVRPETHPLIGPFSNTLVVRVDLSSRPSFRALLTLVLDSLVEAFDHQSLSFAELIEELQPTRDLSRSPLFQAMFDPTRFRSRHVSAAGGAITMVPHEVSSEVSSHDLTLLVNERDDPVRVKLEYNTALYERDTARRLLSHYRALLERIAEDPDRAIGQIPLLSPVERNQLVFGWNATSIEHPERPLVHEEIAMRASHTPNAAAICIGDRELGYRELDERANQLAHHLGLLGVGPNVLVALCLERSFEMIVGMLGVLKAGGAYVPLDPTHPVDRNKLILEEARPRVILTQQALQGSLQLPAGTEVIALDAPLEGPASPPATSVGPGDLAYVIFTSGSTGRPKGVQIHHAALSNFLWSMRTSPGLRSTDRLLAVTTISFDIAALEIFLPLVVGGVVDVADRETCIDAQMLRAHLEQKPVTVMQATPATWRMLIEAGWKGSRNLKLLCGGEGMARDLADSLLERAASVWNMYGPTETTIWSSVHPVAFGGHQVPIGRPIDNTTMHVLDPRLEPVPVGVVGELMIGGRGLARGYHQRPELTQDKFVKDPFSVQQGARLYKTGDLARRLATGELICLGRADFQVKIRGFRIELGEIEAALLSHSDVKNVAVIAREMEREKQLVAYVEARRKIGDERLRAHLEQKLPAYMIPARFVEMDALPLTPNGKVDRKVLPAPAKTRETSAESFLAPTGDLEVQMAAIWKELLSLDRVGRNESFFELGGHSLLAVRLTNRVNRECGVYLPLGAVFQTPTIAELAAIVDAEWRHREPSVIELESGGDGLPLFCICGIHLYAELARHLGKSRSVYGVFVPIEAELFNGESQPVTVEELAAEYVRAIRATQENGPYCLTGVSFGGVLAYEIARQLTAQGERVRFLALLDSLLPRALSVSPKRWLKARMNRIVNDGPRGIASQLSRVSTRLREAVVERLRPNHHEVHPRPDDEDDDLTVSRNRIYNRATVKYDREQHRYAGPVILVRAQDTDETEGYAVDSCFGWNELVRGGVHLYEIPGGHLDILAEPYVSALAEKLRIHLEYATDDL